MSTHAGGKNCFPYSIEVSPLLDAFVLIGSSFTLSVVFSASRGEMRLPYDVELLPPAETPPTDIGPFDIGKVFFKGLNLKILGEKNSWMLTCPGGRTLPGALLSRRGRLGSWWLLWRTGEESFRNELSLTLKSILLYYFYYV